MPLSKLEIEIGNLVIRFGDKFVLLHLFDEVIKPAFFDKSFHRTYGETTYVFNNPTFLRFDDELAIAGRLVKNTVLEREQVLEGGQLKRATGNMPSAPSSFFVLFLGCHRLLFVREHKGSPSMDVLASTLKNFIRHTHRNYLRALAKVPLPETGIKPSKSELDELYPRPTVKLTPVGSNESIQQFLDRFKKLKSMTAELLATNNELDNDELFEGLRDSQERMNSKKTSLHYSNNEDGLSLIETAAQVTALATQANHAVHLKGEDKAGGDLNGNNDSFKMKVHLDEELDEPKTAAPILVQHWYKLLAEKIITVPPLKDNIKVVLQRLADENL